MASRIPSEDLLSQKWDRCLSNFVVKTGLGLGVGIVASALFFKKRTWPISLAGGWGFGMAYADCERTFHRYALPGVQINKEKPLV